MDFHGLNRKKLQELCKKHGIPANLKNVEMADRLSSLLLKEEVPEKAAAKRGRSCLKNVSEDVEVVDCEKVELGSKEVKKVRFSPENQTFLFERTDPRAIRLLARKKRAFVNSRKEKDPVVVSVNLEESERLGVVSDDVGRVVEPVGKRNLRRGSVVISEDVGLVGKNDENVVKLGRNLRSRRGELIPETNESVEMVSREENVVKGRNLRRSSRRSLVEAKDLGLASENVDDGEKLPTKAADFELNLRSRRSKMKQDDVEVISLLSPCPGDNVNKPETVDHVEKLPAKEDNLELNLRSRRLRMKQDNVEVVSLLSPCGGVGGDNVNKAVEGRNPKRSLRSRGGIEKENGVGGASLMSPCVEKKAKRGTKGKGIAEEGGGEEVDKPQNEMVNHGGNIGRVTRKQLRNVDVVAVNLGRDDDCVDEVSGLNNLKKRGRPRKSVRLAEHSPELILEPMENKGIKRGRRKTLMVKQHDINEGRDVVVEKLGEGNNIDGTESRESAKKSRKNVKDNCVEELPGVRRSSRRAAKTKVDISVAHQTMHHDERIVHMIEDNSPMPAQLEGRNPEVNEQYKATEEINVQLPINDETTLSLLRNNGDDEANMGHECPSLVVATEEVNVQITINNVGGDGTGESAKTRRRSVKNCSVGGSGYIRRSGRRAAKNAVDSLWSPQMMHHVERIDSMIRDDSQMVAQLGSRSPEVNEEYQATVAVNVQMPVNDDSTTPLSQNRDDDDEANKAQDCPELIVATDYDSEDKNASPCSMTAQICEQYKATEEVNVQIPINDETTTSLLRSNGEDEANKGHEYPGLVVATEEVNVQISIYNVGGDGTAESAKTSRRNDKNGSVEGLDCIRRSGRRAAKNTVDISWSPQTMHHVESIDYITEDDSQMVAQHDSRSPEVNEQYQATEAVDVQMPVDDASTPALLRNRDDDDHDDDEANKVHECPELVVVADYNFVEENACFSSMTAQICDAVEANHTDEEQPTSLSNELESGMVASETLESNALLQVYGPINEEKLPEMESPSKKEETDFQGVNEKPDALETVRIAGTDIVAGDSTPAANTEGQTHENKNSVPKEHEVENLREAQINPMQLEVCKNTETNSLMHNDFDGVPNQAQEITSPLSSAFDGSFKDENASVARDAVEGTIDDTSFSSVTAENLVGTSEPICSSAIQSTLLRSRESVCVHEDINIMRNCEDFGSNEVPELHDYEVNEQRKEEEEFEELSSPCKDNAMGSELLEDSAIFVDNIDFQLPEPSKVCGTTGECKSIFVHEPPSSSRSDTNIMRNSEGFESNGVPELHDYEMNEQSREEKGFEELSTPCKDISTGSELLEVSEIIVDKLDVQLTEQSKVSGSTGACNSIYVHAEQPSSSRSDTNIMKNSEDVESNGVPELHDYEMIKQSTEDEVFEEMSSPYKDNSMESVLLEVSANVDKLDVQLTEQSKYPGSAGACISICLSEKQPCNSRSDINILKNSESFESFESNGVTELQDYETNEQAEDERFEGLSSPCKDNATRSELLEVSAVTVDKFDVQLTEQSNVSGSTGASDSIFKEADQTISEISAAEVGRREESCNDTSGGKFLCSAKVCKTDQFVEFSKTTLEQSEQVKKSPEPNIQPFILEDDFINTTEASDFTAASCDSESMKLNIDEHSGATRDNFSVEQKAECFTDAIAFSPRNPNQFYVTDNTVQLEDCSNEESGLKEAPENTEPCVQTLANAAAAVSLYQTGHVGADYTFQEDKFISPPCNSKEGASLRSTEAQYGNSTSEQQELADNNKDFEYCLQHLFSEADIPNTNEIKGLGLITDDNEEDLKETRPVSQVTMFKVDSSLRGQVADDIEDPSTDEMDMDEEDVEETPSVSQVSGSKAHSSLRKQVANDIEGPSTNDMDVDNNQKSVPPLNEDSETKICSMGKANTILAAPVSMELLKEEAIEEATQIPPSTLQLNMAYYTRLSEECDGEKESEMSSPTLTNNGGSNPSSVQMTGTCTEVQEEHVSTPPIIVQGTLNDNFGSNVGLATSPENENKIGYNMPGSNVGLTDHEEVGRSRLKSDIIHKECGDGEWPTEFISEEKLEAGGEASVKGRIQSLSVMEESTPKVSPATLQKVMEDAKDVTVTSTRLQDSVSDGRSKKRKSESGISVQTSSSYLKTRVIGEPTVFSSSMEKDEESCKESKVGDIACSGNSRKVDYLKFIQKSPNEDAKNLVFEDDLMTFDNEKNLESDKTARVTEGADGHYVFSKDEKLNESPSEEANKVFKDDLMNLEKERDMDSDKTPGVIEGNDDGHYISSQDKKLNEPSNQDANNLVSEDDLMNFDKERDLESDKTLRCIEGNDEGHHVFSQDKKSNESASEDANNLVYEDDLMNFDNERDLESDKTSRVTEGNNEEHHVSSQDDKSNESANENANNVVIENDLMNLDKESELKCDKTLRVTEGNDEDHVSSQDNKSNESANVAANDLVLEDDFMNFDKERDLEADKSLKVAEGHHVSPQDKKSIECANEEANSLFFKDDLMNFDKESDLESDKPSSVSSQKKSDEQQYHHCSNSSNADLSSFIMGLMEKDISEMFHAEESSPFLSHDETDHKLDDFFSNQFPHESDSRPDQDGNIVMSEAEELVAWDSAMQMHHETTSEASYPMNDGNTGHNQLKFSSGKDIHANSVVDVTEINEDDNLAKEGLCPLSDSEKKPCEMDELLEVDPEVKSLLSSNSLPEIEDTNHLRGCKQVEMETYMDTAALEDGSGDELCAEAGNYITGNMTAQQNDLEEQVDYRIDPVQDDACEISTSQLAFKCPDNSESLPHDIHEISGFDADTRDNKSFNSEACIQLKGDEGIHVNFTAEDAAITGHTLLAMEGTENSSISLSVDGRDGMESPLQQINQEDTGLVAQRVGEQDATDDKMMLKRRNRSELIYGTPRKPLLPTIDMKENMAAPKRMQMVNATATKPGIKRKALGKILK